VLLLLILIPAVYAQLSWDVTDLRCGDGKLDEFELCEKNVDKNWCDELADLLEIDTACDQAHCTCAPRVNRAFCGNDKREGVEVCDGAGDNFCEEYGNLIGLKLSCNPDTCGCKIDDAVPADYNPLIVDELEQQANARAVCGDKEIGRGEDCDPPNTLCTKGTGEAGVCTEFCECLTAEELVALETENSETERNESAENQIGALENETVVQDEQLDLLEEETEEKEIEQKGFLARLWEWIILVFA